MQSQQQRASRILRTILSDSDRKIYAMIKEYPSTKKDLGQRTKFPSNLLDKILKELSSYNLIKSIKRPESKNMNVWVLASHKEEQQACNQVEEKEDLMNIVRKKEGTIAIGDLQKEVVRKGIKIDRFEQILGIMEMRGQINISDGKVIKRQLQLINSPCMQCNLRDICGVGCRVSPSTCPYLIAW